ncbi:hypothetical protein SDC9_203532 [bioreactor metagenome]|uniref:Uncharacterized protein n=1 Tax=bioreactor metagenome TaxID=1076179 RepID=A0A645IWR9_9ZZZZ
MESELTMAERIYRVVLAMEDITRIATGRTKCQRISLVSAHCVAACRFGVFQPLTGNQPSLTAKKYINTKAVTKDGIETPTNVATWIILSKTVFFLTAIAIPSGMVMINPKKTTNRFIRTVFFNGTLMTSITGLL